MSQTLETWGKVMAGGAMLGKGIGGINKAMKKLSPEARVERAQKKQKNKQDKDIAKIEREAAKDFLRKNGSLLQAMSDRMAGTRAIAKSEEALNLIQKEKTRKMKEELKDEDTKKQWKDEKKGKDKDGNDLEVDESAKAKKKKVKEPTLTPDGPSPLSPKSGGPSVEGESLGLDEATAMYVTDAGIVELLAISRESHQLDKERSQREIKAERRALEDSRDKKKGAMLGLGKGGGGPSLVKKDKPGWFSEMGKSILSLGTKYLLPIATSVGGLIGLKKFLQGADNADDIARAAEKIDELAKGAKTVATKLDKVDDTARLLAKTSQLGTHVKNVGLADDALEGIAKTSQLGNKVTLADDALRGVARTSQLGNKVTLADDALKGIAKTSNIVNLTSKFDDVAKASQLTNVLRTTTTKFDDLARAGTYADEFAGIGNKIKAGTEATQSILQGGVRATNVGKLTTAIDGLTTVSSKLATSTSMTTVAGSVDNVATTLGNVGGKIDDVAVQLNKVDEIVKGSSNALKVLSASDETAKAAAAAARVSAASDEAARVAAAAAKAAGAPTVAASTGTNILATADNAAGGLDDAARIAAKNAETAKLLKAGGSTGGKLLSRFGKALAPLDIFNKMQQGQGLFESIANMGVELSGMVVGLADVTAEYNSKGLSWLTGGFMTESGQGLLGNKDSEGLIKEGNWGDKKRALEQGDILGNKEKWDTSLLEKGINWSVAKATGTEQTANKKQWTEEQKELAYAAEDTGAVDVNYLGQGDIDDLEKLSLLDPKSLEALLAYEVWSDKDMKMIERLLEAKKRGVSTTYNDNGFFGKEGIDFGPGADGGPSKFTKDENYTGLTGRDIEMDALMVKSKAGMTTEADTKRFLEIKAMTPDEYDELSPSKELQDELAQKATNPGSIFVHDMHVEKALTEDLSKNLGRTMGSFDSLPGEFLQQQVVSAAMIAEKQATSSGGGSSNMINAPSSIDKSVNQVINPSSTAHSPAMPSGMGNMGVGSRG